MSLSSREDLLGKLVWSQQRYSLADLISQYSLPQVVRVKQGYDGGSESTSLSYDEVLTLHAVKKTRKLMAKDSSERTIAIALECPYKLQILPSSIESNFNTYRVENLSSVYPKTKYLEVLRAHYGTGPGDDSTSVGELLEIIKIDNRDKTAEVQNVETGEIFRLSPKCTAEFKPLRDWRTYYAKDILSQFGFPTKVHFLATNDQAEGDTGNSTHKFIPKVTDVTVIEERDEVSIVATTLGDNIESIFCYELPKDLDVKVEIAEGYLSDEEGYEQVIADLKDEFDVSGFMNSQQARFFKTYDSISEYNYESIRDYYNFPKEISNGASNRHDPSALSSSTVDHSRPASQADVSTIPPGFRPAKVPDNAANANLPLRGPRPSPGDPEGSQIAVPHETNPSYAAPVTDVYQELSYSESEEGKSFYMPLQKRYDVTEAALDHNGLHGDLKSRDRQLSVGSKESKAETEDNYVTISGMPSDLSSLSVNGVCQLLKDLYMDTYVPQFRQEMIDGNLLRNLDRDDLKSLSMNAFHIKKLTRFLEGWRPKQ